MDITARVAQLWCLPKHENKIMDPDFAESIIALVTEAYAAGLAEGEAELSALQKRAENCDRLYEAISTWMPKGFKSHCVDAMMIMEGRIKEAEAKLAARVQLNEDMKAVVRSHADKVAALTAEAGRQP